MLPLSLSYLCKLNPRLRLALASHDFSSPHPLRNSIGIKSKATKIFIPCRSCRTVVPNIEVRSGLEGYAMPRKCNVYAAGRQVCSLDPYFIMPDIVKCVDF